MIDYGKWQVVDIETTVRAKPPYPFPADPACPANQMVLVGYTNNVCGGTVAVHDTWFGDIPHDYILVGHNFKFDLRYAIRDSAASNFHLHGRRLAWDTMIAEYMISGQKVKMASLNDLAEKYLGRKKQDDVKKFWEAGLDTTDIDRDVLERYLRTDVELTRDVYLAQVKHLDSMGAPKLKEHIVRMSAASIYYAYVEHNGLPISHQDLDVTHVATTCKKAADLGRIYDLVEIHTGMPKEHRERYEPMTPANVAAMIFGGIITAEWSAVDPTPTKQGKAGKRRRRYTHTVPAAGLWGGHPHKVGKNGVACVDERALADIKTAAMAAGNGPALTYINNVLDYRSADKLIGTYYEPSLKYLDATLAGVLHPSINTAVTDTGRTSSSSPNGQNMPEEFEACVKSRFPGGVILKADFKQLEVCALAELSRDPQLILDLNNDVDVHFETGKTVYGWRTLADMTKRERTFIKRVNFLLIYGGGAKGAAATLGIKRDLAQKIIDAFYTRYPGVKRWHGELVNKVKAGKQVIPEAFVNGSPQHESFLASPMGRVFRFETGETPDWLQKKGVYVDFQPTQIVNYPVQGYATGDIVPAFFVECLDLCGADRALPINVVHDAGWFDCANSDNARLLSVQLQFRLAQLRRDHPMVVPLKLDFTLVR